MFSVFYVNRSVYIIIYGSIFISKGKSWKVFLVHATKAYVGNGVQLQLFFNLGSRWGWLVNFIRLTLLDTAYSNSEKRYEETKCYYSTYTQL